VNIGIVVTAPCDVQSLSLGDLNGISDTVAGLDIRRLSSSSAMKCIRISSWKQSGRGGERSHSPEQYAPFPLPESFHDEKFPFILLNSMNSKFNYIMTDNRSGINNVMEYLYSLGHRKFLFVQHDSVHSDFMERRDVLSNSAKRTMHHTQDHQSLPE